MSDIHERTKKLLRRAHEVGVAMVLRLPKDAEKRKAGVPDGTELLAGFEDGPQFATGIVSKELAVEIWNELLTLVTKQWIEGLFHGRHALQAAFSHAWDRVVEDRGMFLPGAWSDRPVKSPPHSHQGGHPQGG